MIFLKYLVTKFTLPRLLRISPDNPRGFQICVTSHFNRKCACTHHTRHSTVVGPTRPTTVTILPMYPNPTIKWDFVLIYIHSYSATGQWRQGPHIGSQAIPWSHFSKYQIGFQMGPQSVWDFLKGLALPLTWSCIQALTSTSL